jgi:hypothetical protein
LQRRFTTREWPLLDQRELEESCRGDNSLRPIDVCHARQLHEDLLTIPLLRDAGFGHTKLIHPTLDRLPCLDDGLSLHGILHVRFHGERVGAVGAGTAVEVRVRVSSRL